MKGQLSEIGIVIIGFLIISFILIVHTIPWFKDGFKLNSDTSIFLELNDNTGKILPLLKARVSGEYFSDVIACRLSMKENCSLDDSALAVLAENMDTKLSVYSSGNETESYGNVEKEGSVIYADVPLPNGQVGSVGLTLDIGGLVDYYRDFRESEYGNCMIEGRETYARNHLTTIKFLGKNIRVNKIAAADFLAVAADIEKCDEARNYDFWADETGGAYACRYNTNSPGELSMHAYGLAIDINPSTNPNCPKDPACGGENKCITDLPDCVRKAFNNHNFIWGCQFKSVKDAMHFEWRNPGLGTEDALKSVIGRSEDENTKVTD